MHGHGASERLPASGEAVQADLSLAAASDGLIHELEQQAAHVGVLTD